MSWAAHELENYFIQKHVGVKASFIAIAAGTMLPDFFTKKYVYTAADPIHFHRSWQGMGFTHSFLFGVVCAVIVLALTRSRSWALGILIGQWAHVVSDMLDTAGVLAFFPFSTEPVTIGMWRHAAAAGRHADAAAYYSSLGGVWDFFWLIMVVVFARGVLSADYFRQVVMPADAKVWSFLHRRLHISDNGMLVLYRGLFLFGLSRMTAMFMYARFDAKVPFQAFWGGPRFVAATDLSDAGVLEVLVRTAIGGALFAGFLWLAWVTVIRRLWQRGADLPIVARGEGLHAAFH